ncbi:MAG: tetratricopeptide repeat protein [Nannocystaceae bacterium]
MLAPEHPRAARALGLCGLCLSLALAPVAPVRAAPAKAKPEAVSPEDAARAAYQRGEEAYALGKFEEAVGHFEESYELSKHPELLFNIGQSYQRLYEISEDPKHLRHARTLFTNYIKFLEAAGELDDKERADAEEHIAAIDETLAALAAATEPDEPPDPPDDKVDEPPDDKVEGPAEVDPAPPPGDDTQQKKPVHKKGWFWATVVLGTLAVAGGIAAAVYFGTKSSADIPDPELGTIGASGRAPVRGGPQLGPGGFVIAF